MAQNIYDDPGFFDAYSGLARSQAGLDGAPEWPLLQAMLPPMHGARVVDLGCGYGWFCRWAAEAGAESVLGIDVSERMLARAAEFGHHPQITYRRDDLDTLALPERSADVVYSSLALHYVEDVASLLSVVSAALVPGGALVCSVEHPVAMAPSNPAFIDSAGGTVWPLNDYHREGLRVTDWLAPGVVKFHRRLDTWLGALRAAGLQLTDLVEWGPSADDLTDHPEWSAEIHRPAFLLIGARREHR